MPNQQQIKYAVKQIELIRTQAINSVKSPSRIYMTDEQKLSALKKGEYKIVNKKESCYWYNHIVFNESLKNEKLYEVEKNKYDLKKEKIKTACNLAIDKAMLDENIDLIKLIKDVENQVKKIK
jgi:hypothetical protein